jgi:DNA-binding Lrp family transcriptional regulator
VLSNHGHVLVCIAGDPDSRLRDIAQQVGITERAVFGIVEDLERGGVIKRLKVGRRNKYLINVDQHLRHEIVSDRTVGDLLGVLVFSAEDERSGRSDAVALERR